MKYVTKKAIGAWFRDQRKRLDIEVPEAMVKLGLTKQSISNMERIGMTYETAVERAKMLGFTAPPLEDILSGVTDTSTTLTLSTIQPSAGVGTLSEHEILTKIVVPLDWLRAQYPQIKNLRNLGLCQPRGDSMANTFLSTDTLVADRTVSSFDSEGVFVFTHGDDVFLKRIQRLPGKGVRVISDNKEMYDPYDLTTEELANVTVHAKVVGKWRYSNV